MTYPLHGTNERLCRLEKLDKAVQNRLEVIAVGAGKSALDVRITKTRIFVELGSEQSKLIPPSVGRQREMRNWTAGKGKYWPPIHPDWAVKLVRKASLRSGVGSRRSSEVGALMHLRMSPMQTSRWLRSARPTWLSASDGRRATPQVTRLSNSQGPSAVNG